MESITPANLTLIIYLVFVIPLAALGAWATGRAAKRAAEDSQRMAVDWAELQDLRSTLKHSQLNFWIDQVTVKSAQMQSASIEMQTIFRHIDFEVAIRARTYKEIVDKVKVLENQEVDLVERIRLLQETDPAAAKEFGRMLEQAQAESTKTAERSARRYFFYGVLATVIVGVVPVLFSYFGQAS